MKKKMLSFLLTAATACSLVACGTGNQTATEGSNAAGTEVAASDEASGEVETVTLMLQTSDYSNGMEAVVDYINNNTDKFGAKVEVEKVPDGDEGEQIIQVRYAGGEDVPDILYFQPVAYANTRIDMAENFVDISDDDFSDVYDDSYIKGAGYLLDGKLYGAPIGTVGGQFMFYNKDVLKAAGINEVPTTWDDFIADCDKIKANGVTPVYYSAADTWTLQIIPLMGWYSDYEPQDAVKFAEEMGTNQKHWSEMTGFIDSIAKTKELVDDGYVQDTYLSDTYQQAQQALLDGTCAFYPQGSWVIDELNKIDKEKADSTIGAFLIPLADKLYQPQSVSKCFYVSKNGKNPELAEKIMQAIVSKDGQQAYFDAQPGIPMAKGVTAELAGANVDIKNISDTVEGSFQWTDFCKYSKGPLETYVSEVLVGTKTPEDVAEALDDDFAKQAEDAGDENWK